MTHDEQLLKRIAGGGQFDAVDAIRAIARKLTAGEASGGKAAPPATMDAPESAPAATEAARKKRAAAES